MNDPQGQWRDATVAIVDDMTLRQAVAAHLAAASYRFLTGLGEPEEGDVEVMASVDGVEAPFVVLGVVTEPYAVQHVVLICVTTVSQDDADELPPVIDTIVVDAKWTSPTWEGTCLSLAVRQRVLHVPDTADMEAADLVRQ